MLGPNDMTNCPIQAACESCGAVADLAVTPFETAVGTLCVTLCVLCAKDRAVPEGLRYVGAGRVGRHTAHRELDSVRLRVNPSSRRFSIPV